MKKRIILSFVAAALATTMAVTPVFASAGNIGRMSATVAGTPTSPNMPVGRNLLYLLIRHAEVMIGRTQEYPGQPTHPDLLNPPTVAPYSADFPDGILTNDIANYDRAFGTPHDGNVPADVPVGEWGVSIPNRAIFQDAINRAWQDFAAGSFTPGQEFNIRIGIERPETGGAGFAGMVMEFGIPVELEVVGFSHELNDFAPTPRPAPYAHLDESAEEGFQHSAWLAAVGGSLQEARTEDGRNYFYAGWAQGRDHTNFNVVRNSGIPEQRTYTLYPPVPDPAGGYRTTYQGPHNELFNFRVRVADNTPPGLLPAITVRINNAIAPDHERPTNIEGEALDFTLPCGTNVFNATAGENNTGYVGTIRVVAP